MGQRLSRPTEVTVLASATKTSSGDSGNLKNSTGQIPVAHTISLVLNVSAASGTSETMTVALESSIDGGTTWYQSAVFTQITTAVVTRVIDFRPFLGATEAGAETVVTSTATTAIHKNAPLTEDQRLKWVIGGTNPSYTFSVTAVCQPMEL